MKNNQLVKYILLAEKYTNQMNFDEEKKVHNGVILDIVKNTENIKLKVAKAEFKKDDKAYGYDAMIGSKDTDMHLILNDKLNAPYQRMLIAMTIPHIIFENDAFTNEYYKTINLDLEQINELSTGKIEEKNVGSIGETIFALLLLMPKSTFKSIFMDKKGNYEEVAKELYVPYSAVVARVKLDNLLKTIPNIKIEKEKTKNNNVLVKKLVDKRMHF